MMTTDLSMLKTLARIWAESRGTRLLCSAVALMACLSVVLSLIFVWLTKLIVDAAVGPGHSIPLMLPALLVGCLLLQLLVPAVRRRVETVALTRYANALRRRLLSHLLRQQWRGRDAMTSGDAVNRIEGDVATLASLTCSVIPGLLAVGLQLLGAFIFLAMLEARLAWAVVFIMPVALLASKIYVGRTRRLTRSVRRQESLIFTYLQESLRHRTLISTLMGADRRADRFDSLQQTLTGQLLRRTDISIYSNAVVTAGFMAGYTVVFLWSANGLAVGTVTFGMMTAFLQLVAQVQRPVVDLSHRIPAFINASVAMERVDAILDAGLEDCTPLPGVPSGPLGIRLTDVSYSYPDGDTDVLSVITHDFTPGSITALTGPTGIGKSTLLRIILGLVSPSSGTATVYADGFAAPIGPGLRSHIVYVPQGNTLMHGTVRDNLLLAAPDATEAEMLEALHTAAADFVAELPDGLDTPCFEGGGGFSEGQAQRIAIARGLLKGGSIILLDEPSSALDAATEATLFERLADRLRGRATAIIVTHRDSALVLCTAELRLR